MDCCCFNIAKNLVWQKIANKTTNKQLDLVEGGELKLKITFFVSWKYDIYCAKYQKFYLLTSYQILACFKLVPIIFYKGSFGLEMTSAHPLNKKICTRHWESHLKKIVRGAEKAGRLFNLIIWKTQLILFHIGSSIPLYTGYISFIIHLHVMLYVL